jgi:putative endonuclease
VQILRAACGCAGSHEKWMKKAYVYMMSNRKRGIIYIGATIDFWKRGNEHREKLINGFTKRYNLTRLVWLEEHSSADEAFTMERKLKNLSRNKKIEIIERFNPEWNDLYNFVTEGNPVLALCAPQD